MFLKSRSFIFSVFVALCACAVVYTVVDDNQYEHYSKTASDVVHRAVDWTLKTSKIILQKLQILKDQILDGISGKDSKTGDPSHTEKESAKSTKQSESKEHKSQKKSKKSSTESNDDAKKKEKKRKNKNADGSSSSNMSDHRVVAKLATTHQQREGGGFLVRKVIGSVVQNADPFLMLDHLGPTTYKPGEALGAPDHPHRGFETVTYVIDGGVKHQDSAGNKGVLKSGWVQWMTAGSGVVHSEMPTDDLMKNGGKMEGFQLWVNLPAKLKMIPPRYQDTPADKIPIVKLSDGKSKVKVIAGDALGSSAVIETKTQILVLDVQLAAGGSVTVDVPQSYTGFAYIWRGAGFLGEDKKPAHHGQVGILSDTGTKFTMSAQQTQECHLLLVAGEPIGEPIVKYGPFVMNTQEEINQAIEDYRAGKLGEIPGKEDRLRQTEAAQNVQRKNNAQNKKV